MKTHPLSRLTLLTALSAALSNPAHSQNWLTAGNTLTTAHFLGSGAGNSIGVQFRVNNANRMFIAPATTVIPQNVGIGPFSPTILPQSSLHVHSTIVDQMNVPFATFQLTNNTSTSAANRGIITTLSSTSGTLINREGRMGVFGANGLQLGALVNSVHATILTNGNYGIGTTNPLQRFHMRGGFGLIDGANAALCFGAASTNQHGEYLIEYDVSTDPLNTVYGLNFAKPGTSQSGLRNFVLYLNNQGNIGMSVLPSKINNAYKLSVNGTIRANELVVETGWADYVFEKGYELMPLEDVADFIAEEGHLPNVPSAEEIQECGAPVGETQRMLLAKIEELTLYILDQNRRIVELEEYVVATSTPDGRR